MRFLAASIALLLAVPLLSASTFAAERPNILILTVDDMSADSVGAFGCKLEGTTPHMDRLAESGMRFEYAHVQVGNCFPSRNVMWSGRYPHQTRVEGFYQVKDADHPHLVDLMRDAGYFTAIRGKVSHSTPYQPYDWDLVLDTSADGEKLHVKAADSYGESTAHGIAAAKEAGQPFCVMINVSDPHKPFHAEGRRGETVPDPHVPSRVYTPEEVPIPGFLFDDPVVRKELAHYYSSVRRADDAVGKALAALEESGEAGNTFVLFLSDHGMPLPFAKTQLYHHSTRTPLVVRWPGVTKPGAVDATHMVSAVDFVPTLLDVIGVDVPEGVAGRSFVPLLGGGTQPDRDVVFKEYNENAGASRDPMRAVQTKRHLYLFNPWSNGQRVMATATSGTSTYRRFAELAKSHAQLAARHDLYQHRVVEELYDVEKDPDCLVNLIGAPAHAAERDRLRARLETWMRETSDHALEPFLHRDDPAVLEAYVVEKEREAAARRTTPRRDRGDQPRNRNRNRNANQDAVRRDLLGLQLPKTMKAGETTISVRHSLPSELGKQKLHVTLKGADGKRIERQVVEITGDGTAELTFAVPAELAGKAVSVAVFVGEEFQQNLQHVQSQAIPVE